VSYGAELWTLRNEMERALTCERKILRKICGTTYENSSWRMKMNQGICTKSKSPDIVSVVEVCRLKWLGHVVRMGGERTVKKLLEGKPGGGEEKED
jgi:hypothetical protein